MYYNLLTLEPQLNTTIIPLQLLWLDFLPFFSPCKEVMMLNFHNGSRQNTTWQRISCYTLLSLNETSMNERKQILPQTKSILKWSQTQFSFYPSLMKRKSEIAKFQLLGRFILLFLALRKNRLIYPTWFEKANFTIFFDFEKHNPNVSFFMATKAHVSSIKVCVTQSLLHHWLLLESTCVLMEFQWKFVTCDGRAKF